MTEVKQYLDWLLAGLAFGGIFIRIGKVIDKQEMQGGAIEDNKIASDKAFELVREEVRVDCARCQKACQEATWVKLKLELSERDREFDRKFNTICQGINDIKAEIKRS